MDAAIDLRQLLRGKKGAAGDESGTGGEALFCGGVTVCTALGTISVKIG